MNIGVFGSAFDPPHNGHANVIVQALEDFDRIIAVPAYAHPHGKQMSPFAVRMAMTKAMVDCMGQADRIKVSDIEQTIYETGSGESCVRTYDLMELVQSIHDDQIQFIVGPDNADPVMWKRFYRYRDIETKWGVWVADERVLVRSSMIRSDIAKGELDSLAVSSGVKEIIAARPAMYV